MATSIIASGNELLNARTILIDDLGVRAGQVVADFGCGGAGFFTLAAAEIVGDRGQVYAVDVVKGVLTSVDGKAKLQGLYNVKPIWSDLEVYGGMDIPDGSVDHGLLVNTLFQSKKHDAIVHECTRVIRPGGKLLIVDWNDSAVPFGPPATDRVKVDAIRDIVLRYGYREQRSFAPGQYHYGLIYVKE